MGSLVEKTLKYRKNLELLVIHNKSHSHAKRRKLEKQDLEYQCKKTQGLTLLDMDFRAAVAFQDAAKYGLALFEYSKFKESGLNDTNHNIMAFKQLYEFLWKEKWKPLPKYEVSKNELEAMA